MGIAFDGFLKGLEFNVFGMVEDVSTFKNDEGEEMRMVRVRSAGKTFSLFVDTDDEFRRYAGLVNSLVRLSGVVARVKNSASALPRIRAVMTREQPGWKDPTAEEYVSGCIVQGVVIFNSKRTGIYNGNAYASAQFITNGEVFEIRNVEMDKFEGIPDDGKTFVHLLCKTDAKLSRTDNRNRFTELELELVNYRVLPLDDPAASPRPSPAARETKA